MFQDGMGWIDWMEQGIMSDREGRTKGRGRVERKIK
jgi:hypothetical protein